jgi:hypothetical protein
MMKQAHPFTGNAIFLKMEAMHTAISTTIVFPLSFHRSPVLFLATLSLNRGQLTKWGRWMDGFWLVLFPHGLVQSID